MKKIISILFAIAFTLVGAITLSACGNGKTGVDIYNDIKAQMEVMLEAGSPFKTASSGYVTSNYMLDNFFKKQDNSTKVDYGYQNDLIGLGLNYIEKYFPKVQDVAVHNSAKLLNSLNEMMINYQSLKEEYQSTKKISNDEDMTIFNGFMAKYGEEARMFSVKVYNFANELAAYLEKDIQFTATNVSAEIELYIDSRLMEIYSDYNDYLMVNCKGAIGVLPSNITLLQKSKAKTTFTDYEIKKFTAVFDALKAERKLTQTALNKFSYYDYKVTYNGDITAYQKSLPLAKAYLNQIDKYYLASANFIQLTTNFMTDEIYQ